MDNKSEMKSGETYYPKRYYGPRPSENAAPGEQAARASTGSGSTGGASSEPEISAAEIRGNTVDNRADNTSSTTAIGGAALTT